MLFTAVGDGVKKFEAMSAKAVKNFQSSWRQRLKN
jgi:uncharacterized protein (UPF0264 family)